MAHTNVRPFIPVLITLAFFKVTTYMDVGGIMKIVLVNLDLLWAKNVSNVV